MLLTLLLTALSSLLTSLETKPMQSDISITVTEQVNQPLTYRGSFCMKGRQFLLSMFSYEAAYDGNTFYLYSEDNDELTLSRPEDEELYETNPLLFAKAMVDACNISERTQQDGTTITTLTPKEKNSDLQRLTIRIGNNLPISIELKEAGRTTMLRFVNPKYISTPPVFKIEKKDAFLNDLR